MRVSQTHSDISAGAALVAGSCGGDGTAAIYLVLVLVGRGVSAGPHTFCSACGVVCAPVSHISRIRVGFSLLHLSLQSAQRKVTTRTAGAPRYFLMDSRGIGAGDNSRPAGIYLC